mmetsp:Transcript_36622/g.62887  ORF Transcript_36622/g.62887 Transcript_36622/m.62887 type:complete len:238 (-) Transcript_36622:13-726(-)
MRTFLVTGGNRGIGLALLKELSSRGHSLVATVRDLSVSQELKDINGVIGVYKMDVSDEQSIKDLKESLINDKVTLNGIINNAGIFIKKSDEGEDYQSSLFNLTSEVFEQHFKVNSIGPFLIMKELVPLLKSENEENFPVVATIGSAMGSISALPNHRSAPYRVSKCSVHMITKLFSKEVKDVCFVNIHPGWVKTDMGTQQAKVEVEDSAKGIVNVIESLQLSSSGSFYDYNGNTMTY